MIAFETNSMRELYPELGRAILDEGRMVAPRGLPTIELSPALIVLTDPLDALPTGTGRGVVPALAVVEALSLVAGEADPRLFRAASEHYANFVDPSTGELEVAYGPRLGRQMQDVVARLQADQTSRQAHVNLWHAEIDVPGLRAYPCVTSCGFTARNGLLNCFVEMRSNDFWLGLPYDMFMFTQLQVTLANVLGSGLGSYVHYARSLHVYGKDVDKVEALGLTTGRTSPAPYAGVDGDDWGHAQSRARMLLRGVEPPLATQSELNMLGLLAMKVLPKLEPAP